MFYFLIRGLAVILFKILFRVRCYGVENIPKQDAFILACNHSSYLDPPIVAAACPRVLHFVAKENLFNGPIFGRFLRSLNAFPVKTHSGDLGALRWTIDRLKSGKAILIFPEGGRTPDSKLQPPLKGVGFLAVKANVPVVPVFVLGSYQAWSINSKFLHPAKVRVYFGEPIWPENIEMKEGEDFYQVVAERIMQEIAQLEYNAKRILRKR